MKDIKKANLIRIIVWGAIFLISLLCGILGFISFNNGKGDIGSIMFKTKPVAEAFNELDVIKNYNINNVAIKAVAKKKTIIVNVNTYTGSSSGSSKFEFNYEKLINDDTIYLAYNNTDANIPTIVLKAMIEAVSVVNGRKEGEVFEKYELDDFTQTKVSDGVSIQDNGQIRKAYINLNKSILESNTIITEEDKTQLMCSLNKYDENNESTLSHNIIINFNDEGLLTKLKSEKIYSYENEELYKKYANKVSEKTGTGTIDFLTSKWNFNSNELTYTITSDNTYEDLVSKDYIAKIGISAYEYYPFKNYFQELGLTCK